MPDKDDVNKALLNQLVSMFHFAALQQMGKVKNPMTDKVEQDLQQSRVSIDMIEMLHAKMHGNLSPDEERFFGNVLNELRLNYVDEVEKSKSATTKPEPSVPATPPAQS